MANPAWAAYLSSLQRSGYFGGNIEGSAAHRKLLATAEDNFRASEAYQRSTLELAAPACRIDALLEVLSFARAPLRKKLSRAEVDLSVDYHSRLSQKSVALLIIPDAAQV